MDKILNKNSLVLRKLMNCDEKSFYKAYLEFQTSKEFDFVSHYEDGMEFNKLIDILKDQEVGCNLPKGHVPSTFLFGFVGVKIVGRIMIRHQLNDFLRRIGGHIGYGVIPSERGKGYAKKMFKKSLDVAKLIGLEKVLVSCNEDNNPSRKIIERYGGIFEGTSDQGPTLPKKLLYWIILNIT